MKILDIETILIYLKNWNLYKFCKYSVNFEDTIMVDHILEISIRGVFNIRCLSCSWKNAAWIEDYIKFVTEFPCLLGHPSRQLYTGLPTKVETSETIFKVPCIGQNLLFCSWSFNKPSKYWIESSWSYRHSFRVLGRIYSLNLCG